MLEENRRKEQEAARILEGEIRQHLDELEEQVQRAKKEAYVKVQASFFFNIVALLAVFRNLRIESRCYNRFYLRWKSTMRKFISQRFQVLSSIS